MNTKLFVGNLDFNISEAELREAMAPFGTVVEANIAMDRSTGRPRGFGFVSMSTAEEAQKAIAALNGRELGGRTLTVSEARPREDRPAGGEDRRQQGAGPRRGYGGGENRDRY
jgi:RNA recognition motif-containing protein